MLVGITMCTSQFVRTSVDFTMLQVLHELWDIPSGDAR